MPQPTITCDTVTFGVNMRAWLNRIGLTLEDVERTILHACSLNERGLAPSTILNYFREAHADTTPDGDAYVGFIALLLARAGELQRLPGGTYVTAAKQRPSDSVVALVRIPVDDWGRFGLSDYVHRGRAAYVTNDGDCA